MRLATSSSILLCPAFPPSPLLRPFAARVLPYIHDDFLLTRRADLNRRARLIYGRAFQTRTAPLSAFPRQFERHQTQAGGTLPFGRRSHAVPAAGPQCVRPAIDARAKCGTQSRNRSASSRSEPWSRGRITARRRRSSARCARKGFPGATLDIVGRQGWGDDWQMLETIPGVTLHGYQPAEQVRRLLDAPTCSSAPP